MSRARQLLTRPISEDERPRLFATVAAALLAVTGVLTVIAPAGEHAPGPPVATRSTAATAAATGEPAAVVPVAPPAAVTAAGRAFLEDYLAFVHGHTRGRPAFAYATRSLARRLAGYQLRVPPAARDRRPHVVRLTTRRTTDPAGWLVTATIADGGVASYPIELVIAPRDGRPAVTQIGEE